MLQHITDTNAICDALLNKTVDGMATSTDDNHGLTTIFIMTTDGSQLVIGCREHNGGAVLQVSKRVPNPINHTDDE